MPKIERRFLKMLKQHGHPVLLVSTDKEIRCHCYDHHTGSTDPSCLSCLGRGWTFQVRRHLCIDEVAATPETLPRLIRQHETGGISVSARHYYLPSSARPKAQDLLAFTEFDPYGRPISAHMEIYEINHVFSYRSNQGKIIAFRASGTQDSIQVPIKSAVLRGSTYWPAYK